MASRYLQRPDYLRQLQHGLLFLRTAQRNLESGCYSWTLRRLNPAAAILYTRGAAGASLHAGEAVWHCPAAPVTVVDTIGAGDASMAAILFSLYQRPDRDYGEHLAFAVAGGALACAASGAHSGTLTQLTELADSLKGRVSTNRQR